MNTSNVDIQLQAGQKVSEFCPLVEIVSSFHRKLYPRRLPFAYREETRAQVDDMLEQGVIQPSSSPCASPIVLVKKKDGKYRFCVDYRKLKKVTKKDAHTLPRIDDLLDALQGSKYFSTLGFAVRVLANFS